MNQHHLNPLGALSACESRPQAYQLYHVSIAGRGILYAGICWEVQGGKSRVTECIIVWFAIFSYYDRLINLMEEGQ
jgi:hypothetical protein